MSDTSKMINKYNEDWKNNPNIHKGEITLNYENVKDMDKLDYHWNMY